METIYHCFIIDASRNKVFSAISNIHGITGWWTTSVRGTYEKQESLHFIFGDSMIISVEVSEIRPLENVVWICRKGPIDWINTKLSFTLEENDGNTLVKFKHSHWAQMNDFFGECNFHWAHFLRSLKLFCETGKGTPYNS